MTRTARSWHQNSLKTIGDDGKLCKVVSWYDNEWGYSCRTADLVAKMGAM